jgi:hypothetical protein
VKFLKKLISKDENYYLDSLSQTYGSLYYFLVNESSKNSKQDRIVLKNLNNLQIALGNEFLQEFDSIVIEEIAESMGLVPIGDMDTWNSERKLFFENGIGGFYEVCLNNYFIYPIGNISKTEIYSIANKMEAELFLKEYLHVSNKIFPLTSMVNNAEDIATDIDNALSSQSYINWRAN